MPSEAWVALRAEFGDRVKVGEQLARYTTARIGGPADLLIEATSADDLKSIVLAARRIPLAIFILGGGSNVLVSDTGVRGLTIIDKAKRIEFRANNQVWCESGVVLPTLARECIARGLAGLEWAIGVPGTVGGAVVGNAGAHGRDIAADLLSATILNSAGEVEEWTKANLAYEYRSSRIKREARSEGREANSVGRVAEGEGHYVLRTTHNAVYSTQHVVLAATFQLAQGDPSELESRAAAYNEYRRRTQPPGASIGSMFKNPPGDAAGRLIDQAGLKGTRVGGAQISKVHANFFVNHGEATASDVKTLIDHARETVKATAGVELELEIELVGEW